MSAIFRMLKPDVSLLGSVAQALCLALSLAISAPCQAEAARFASIEKPDDIQLRISMSDGSTRAVPLDDARLNDARPVAFGDARISGDGRLLAWLSLFPNCCTSYPIPLQLVVMSTDGTVIARLVGNGLPIWTWGFRARATRVALKQSPTHGPTPDHYELRDIRSGKLVDTFDAPQQGVSDGMPAWARDLD